MNKIGSLPSRKECLQVLKEVGLPRNIIEHSLLVNKVAVFLAKKLRQAGARVDVALVDRASLLHDVDKHWTLEEGRRHGKLAKNFLLQRGWRKIAVIAEKHVLEKIRRLRSLEEKIVFYADKRVTRNRIVSVRERFAYLKKRYGKSPRALAKIAFFEEPVLALEKRLLKKIGLKPSEVRVR